MGCIHGLDVLSGACFVTIHTRTYVSESSGRGDQETYNIAQSFSNENGSTRYSIVLSMTTIFRDAFWRWCVTALNPASQPLT